MLEFSADGKRLVKSILIKFLFPPKWSSSHLSKSSSSFSSTWFKARNIRVCDKLEMRPQLKIPGREIQFPLLPISSSGSFSHLLLHITNSRSFCPPLHSPYLYIHFIIIIEQKQAVRYRWWWQKTIKHPKNCECCPGHYLIVNHYSSMSPFKFRNLSVVVNCVTKSLIH